MNSLQTLIIGIILLFLAGGFYFVATKNTFPKLENISAITTAQKTSITAVDQTRVIPTNWEGYTNESLGYSIHYPSGYEASSNGTNSIKITKRINIIGQGSTNFIYVSVIPDDFQGNEGTIYGYIPKDLDIMQNMQIGEATSLSGSDERNLSGENIYTRISDAQIAGLQVKAYRNSMPSGFPDGTTEYRYLLNREAKTYLIGGYVGGSNSSTDISENEFQQIISTIQLR